MSIQQGQNQYMLDYLNYIEQMEHLVLKLRKQYESLKNLKRQNKKLFTIYSECESLEEIHDIICQKKQINPKENSFQLNQINQFCDRSNQINNQNQNNFSQNNINNQNQNDNRDIEQESVEDILCYLQEVEIAQEYDGQNKSLKNVFYCSEFKGNSKQEQVKASQKYFLQKQYNSESGKNIFDNTYTDIQEEEEDQQCLSISKKLMNISDSLTSYQKSNFAKNNINISDFQIDEIQKEKQNAKQFQQKIKLNNKNNNYKQIKNENEQYMNEILMNQQQQQQQNKTVNQNLNQSKLITQNNNDEYQQQTNSLNLNKSDDVLNTEELFKNRVGNVLFGKYQEILKYIATNSRSSYSSTDSSNKLEYVQQTIEKQIIDGKQFQQDNFNPLETNLCESETGYIIPRKTSIKILNDEYVNIIQDSYLQENLLEQLNENYQNNKNIQFNQKYQKQEVQNLLQVYCEQQYQLHECKQSIQRNREFKNSNDDYQEKISIQIPQLMEVNSFKKFSF
ncbi:hypothetical protein PPERSA_05816 [Pseudocohnilembus persalinus]|uniref:Uncharacterized protein n=1 Tax=Pseudocohnilembus persalinus TaxID=266149 RepID=A0A0V0QG84_PSEPJ|nr:hypothetical protein PPERSA_05816 [Pseudocohnilembus persalinus]|eukprot:KRX01230.1 hypothetical protein PPERSA_05816 [Pseudocohnilembus persalinus]